MGKLGFSVQAMDCLRDKDFLESIDVETITLVARPDSSFCELRVHNAVFVGIVGPCDNEEVLRVLEVMDTELAPGMIKGTLAALIRESVKLGVEMERKRVELLNEAKAEAG